MRDVRLVAADERQHVVGLDGGGQLLGLAQRGHRLVVAARLRERDAEQRVAQREVAPIAGGVERRDRLADLLADDRRVADLPVADAQLVVREADGARVVRELGLLQRAAVERDRARLVAAARRQPAVQPPQRRQPRGRDPLAEHVRRPAEHGRRLLHVVPEQPGLGHRASRSELVLAAQRRERERLREPFDRLRASAALERGRGACHQWLQGLGGHGESITRPQRGTSLADFRRGPGLNSRGSLRSPGNGALAWRRGPINQEEKGPWVHERDGGRRGWQRRV